MEAYMKIDGIQGPIKTGPYQGWFNVLRAELVPVRAATREKRHMPPLSPVRIARWQDDGSPYLLQQLYRVNLEVTLAFVMDFDGHEGLRVKYHQASFSSYNASRRGALQASESIEVNAGSTEGTFGIALATWWLRQHHAPFIVGYDDRQRVIRTGEGGGRPIR